MTEEHTPLVLVRWADATTYYGWYTEEEARNIQPIEVETYGILLHKGEGSIVIAPSMSASVSGDDQYRCADPFVIPSSWCQEIKYLGVADE